MLENWKHWEGQVVDATVTLRTFLGGSSQSAVYLIEYSTGAEREKAAVKLIPADPQDADAQLARWKRVAELSHPHLIRLLQMGRCELDRVPLLYVVMELADENLSEILPHRPLTAEETREMLAPILDALAYVHEKGFAHTAIKPANIMAVGDRVKISSDRLVTIGERRYAVSAPNAYSPPEASRGVISPSGEVSPAGDIWSLGMTLVEVLTQALPTSESASSEGPTLPPGVPQPFLDIARHSLRHEVKRRWTLAQIAARTQAPVTPIPLVETPESRATAPSPKLGSKVRYALPAIAAVLLTATFLGVRHLRHITLVAPRIVTAPSASPTQQVSPAVTSKPPDSGGTVAITSPSPSAPLRSPQEANTSPQGDTRAHDTVAKRVLPEVSPSARDTIQGTIRVAIRLTVDSSGNVAAATFDYRGPSGYFADRAMQAARQWKFAPAAGNVPGEWLLRFEITRTSTNAFADPANP